MTKDSMQNNDAHERQWYLATKALSQSLSPAEEKEWNELLTGSAKFRKEFERIELYWHKMEDLPYGNIDVDADWQKVLSKIGGKRRANYGWLFRYAAVISLLAVTSYLILKYNNIFISEKPVAITAIEAPAGSRTYVTLPDSSTVWLNADSKITMDSDFGTSNRKITLDGEAFFDVEKREVPFSVFTSQYNISVLGTAFNVRAYADDDTQVTTLVRGSLRVNNVRTSEGRKTALLKPGDRLTLWKDSTLVNQKAILDRGIDISSETAWKEGWLTVRSESLDVFAKKLERLYDITIEFEEEELRKYRYTGKIKQLSLEQVLRALALTSPIQFNIKEKTVTIGVNENTRSKYRSLEKPKN